MKRFLVLVLVLVSVAALGHALDVPQYMSERIQLVTADLEDSFDYDMPLNADEQMAAAILQQMQVCRDFVRSMPASFTKKAL